MWRVFRWLGFALVVLIAVLAFNTWRYTPVQTQAQDITLPDVDATEVAAKLSAAIRFKTISHPYNAPNRPDAFDAFLAWLPTAFPAALEAMTETRVGGYTPIYHWQGQDPDQPATLISGHYDVVPIEGEWSRDPWAGEIADGYVWGRGALDMKGGVITLLEAVDRLAAQGFQPQQDIYIALTQDEEIGGAGGAGQVVEWLKRNEIAIDWSLDEGSFVLRDIISAIDTDIASINVAEKGYMTVKITARGTGGHSSLPHRDTAVSKLATAITELQDGPVPGGLDGLSADFFDQLGRHMGLPERVLFANQWLFRPVIESVLSGANTTDAMLRTTKAPTMLRGSEAENVLPQEASVFVNFRLHPRDDHDAVLDHINAQIHSDEIEIEVINANAASPVAAHENTAFQHLARTAQQVFGEIAVVPGLTIAGTDSKRYSAYADNSYRFLPFVFTGDDLALIHGRDERVSVENLSLAVQYYEVLLRGL